MGIKYKNNAITTITSDIDNEITTIPVSNAAVFPELGENDYCYLTIGEGTINIEIVKVTAIVGNNLTVVREQQGTIGRSFLSGAPIELRLTAGMLQAGFDEVADFASGYTDTEIGKLGTAAVATVGTGDTHLPTVATVNTKIADAVKINTLTEKETLVDNDLVGGENSASSFARIKIKCLAIFNYIIAKLTAAGMLPKTQLTTNTTFTVGTGGDYTDLATACYDVYNKYYPKAVAGGITVEIKCLSGYIMSNPLHIRQGVDMGFITITGEDTVVKINPESWANGTTRAFYGILNTTLPTLEVRFDMEGKQNSASQNVDGLMVTYSSKAVIADGGNVHGIINCSGRGVYAYINSEVDMDRTVVSSTTTDAVVAERGSKISAGQTSATHGGSGVGYRVERGSIISIRNGTGYSGTVSQTVNTVTGNGIIFQA